MTQRETTDALPTTRVMPVTPAEGDSGAADLAPVRDVRTATFALG